MSENHGYTSHDKVRFISESEKDGEGRHHHGCRDEERSIQHKGTSVDFVLSYARDGGDDGVRESLRKTFLERLVQDEGLELDELQYYGGSKGGYGTIKEDEEKESKVHFIKVHAPIEVLYDSAEDLNMKMPTKPNDIIIKEWYKDNKVNNFFSQFDPFRIRNPETHESTNYFVIPFDKERLTEFYNHDKPDIFFTPAERGRLVYYILQKAKFGDETTDIGIGNLVHKGVFLDAFPLHDGPTRKSKDDPPVNERQRLQADWASFRCLFKYQPIDAIREYFGEKVALYFAWLGFYVMFLIPAAFVGILCFIYGVVSAFDTPTVKDACSDPPISNATGGHLFYMCPLCDKRCSYYLLQVTCLYAKITHFFDNEATLFFAIFMSIWATMFLEFWKRRQISFAYEWHSIGFEESEEQVRPEYAAADTVLKRNPISGKQEPYMPKGKRFARLMGTVGVVAFFIVLVIIAVVGVVVFRAALGVVLIASKNVMVRERSKIIIACAAGMLNLVAINILKFIYKKVAVILTDWENPRTRTDYEDSFTIKMFLFQFFNTYSSIIYVAFLKGENITGTPGNYKRWGASKFRLDGCSSQGCFLELTIQLIIIMVGQQFISNIIETLLPTTLKWWNERKAKKAGQVVESEQPQWVDDYEGEMQTKFSLFWEYLEIVLQYGFVTMFVAAFPLAPFFALLNNVIEIRVDAYNYVHNCRRPVAQRAEDIGAWYGILSTLTNVSVLINAFVLAFTSELIPRLVYRYSRSPDGTLNGFVNYSLSYFNVKDFTNESRPLNATAAGIPVQDQCRYPGYHSSAHPYTRNLDYWMILTARLSFVLAFVIFVMFVSWLVAYIIPDIPKNLELKIKREKFLELQGNKDHKEKHGKRRPRPDHDRVDDEGTEEEEEGANGQSTSPV